jgi:hypothetical protein
MRFNAARLLTVTLFALVLVSWNFTAAAAQTQVCVYIMNPTAGGVKGVVSGGYWIGEIPVKVGDSLDTVIALGERTRAYCMNFDRTIQVGCKYSAHITDATDTAEWRAVSYILTWFDPPADSGEAARNQVAIWRTLNDTRGYDYQKPSWVDPSIDVAATNLVGLAYGKDVVREGDRFEWISPASGNLTAVKGDPGENITFKARITKADGTTPRPNVKVLFTAVIRLQDSGLGSAGVSPAEAYTDIDGVVEVTVAVPSEIQAGSTIEVKASTKGVWPRMYLDLDDSRRQDLIGFDTSYELTVSTDICILATIFFVPEIPLGTIAIVGTCLLAFMAKRSRPRLNPLKR